jgi:L-threonate 2-dehydrogenase
MSSTIGVIGVGAMGMGIAVSLQRAGHPVMIHDTDPSRSTLARHKQLDVAESSAELAQVCDVIFIVVVNAEQIRQILDPQTGHPQTGLLNVLARQHTVLICSTIAAGDMVHFAGLVTGTGAKFVDAPISGGPARAENGSMSMMLAAPEPVLTELTPILEQISGKRFMISSKPGDASKAKLVNNLLAGIHLVAAAEAFALAKRFELDEQQMFELICASSGQSWMLEDRVPRALQGDLQPRAAAHVITKDLTLVNAAARELGLDLVLGEAARAEMQKTCDAGWRADDDAAVITRLRLPN